MRSNHLIPQAQKIFGDFVAIQAPREVSIFIHYYITQKYTCIVIIIDKI